MKTILITTLLLVGCAHDTVLDRPGTGQYFANMERWRTMCQNSTMAIEAGRDTAYNRRVRDTWCTRYEEAVTKVEDMK